LLTHFTCRDQRHVFLVVLNGWESLKNITNCFQSGSPRRDKFNRYESGSDKDESEEEEEEIETETEVEVTDSENEAEAEAVDQQKDKSDVLSTSAMKDDEDVLNVDCRDEVDEFSKFLNECETELVNERYQCFFDCIIRSLLIIIPRYIITNEFCINLLVQSSKLCNNVSQ
jgi:hypothetical protein